MTATPTSPNREPAEGRPAREPAIAWYRCAVDKDTLRRLSTPSDGLGFAQTLPHFLLLAATGTAAYYAWYHWPWPATVALIYLHATCYAFLGFAGAAHELSHGSVFKTRFWNECFLRVVCFLSWTNFVNFRASHTKHHAYTVHADRDLEVVLPQSLARGEWFWSCGFHLPGLLATLRRTIRLAAGVLEGPWEHLNFPERDAARRRQLFRWSRLLLVGHVALAATFLWFHLWPMFFLITLAPFCGNGLNLLCWFPQHAGLSPNVSDFRLSCRTIILHPCVRFLYWSMNYHVEHHMYPGVPGYRLGALRKVIEADLPPADRGLRATWRRLYPILRRQRTEPQFAYIPALPPRPQA